MQMMIHLRIMITKMIFNRQTNMVLLEVFLEILVIVQKSMECIVKSTLDCFPGFDLKQKTIID